MFDKPILPSFLTGKKEETDQPAEKKQATTADVQNATKSAEEAQKIINEALQNVEVKFISDSDDPKDLL